MIARSIRESSLAALAGLLFHYLGFYTAGWPLLTEAVAEWIMARTPNTYSVMILGTLGEWAKPFALTGGLAALGFILFAAHLTALRGRAPWMRIVPAALIASALLAALAWALDYRSSAGMLSFILPAMLVLGWKLTGSREVLPAPPTPARREFLATAGRVLTPVILSSGTAAVAVESWARDRALARKAVEPVPLWPFSYPEHRESFAPGLVRRAVTGIDAFYGMSKNAVDPAIDPREWRLKITLDGRPWRELSYQQLLALPRLQRYTTMRCVSNTLKSNLMGTAEWSGILLRQLVDPQRLPSGIVEAAFIGVEGHDDSLPLQYAFSEDVMLALGMNGQTLNRVHGFPVRLLAPRYYGFKSVKWLGEIRFVSKPYFGTWPKLGYTKEPRVHTMSFIDRVRREENRLALGGVAFAGVRGIRRVELRAGSGPWVEAQLEEPLSRYTLTRWKGEIVPAADARIIEARALDGEGQWQATEERPIFPDGVAGPTVKRL